jgi:hypothetical protein
MPPQDAGPILAADAASHVRKRARITVWREVETGAEDYRRERHLPRLLPLMPAEVADTSTAMRRTIVARLARALRAERARGRAGHWTYDLNRHIALSQAYTAERRLLEACGETQQGAG